MKFRSVLLAAAILMLWGVGSIIGATENAAKVTSNTASVQQPGAMMPELKFEFEPVVDGTIVTHDFVIKNVGSGVLNVNKVKTG
jgi:uncharacterized membrane protein